MHLVAVLSADADVRHALHGYRDADARFHLHPVPGGGMQALYRALARLEFAGALVLDQEQQVEALRAADRSSLDAQEVGAADTVTVTPGGVIVDYILGRAVSALLAAARWDGRDAHVVVLGSGPSARAVARELASLGAASLALLADSPSEAERALPSLAAGTRVLARAVQDPLVPTLLREADLVVRLRDGVPLPDALLGPHLTLLDLLDEPVSAVRRRAMNLGALTFNRRDLDAYRVELGLRQVLGGPVGVDGLLTLFHEL